MEIHLSNKNSNISLLGYLQRLHVYRMGNVVLRVFLRREKNASKLAGWVHVTAYSILLLVYRARLMG
jgi:hypothetical protein